MDAVALLRTEHVVEVRGRLGCERGARARPRPGLAIGVGGRPASHPRVVRRRRSRCRPSSSSPSGVGSSYRSVASIPRAMPAAQAFVDHARDQRPLAVDLRLALHHRGDDHGLVRGDPEVLGVLPRKALRLAVELRRACVRMTASSSRPFLDELVGLREQEPLGGRGPLRQVRRQRVAAALGEVGEPFGREAQLAPSRRSAMLRSPGNVERDPQALGDGQARSSGPDAGGVRQDVDDVLERRPHRQVVRRPRAGRRRRRCPAAGGCRRTRRSG